MSKPIRLIGSDSTVAVALYIHWPFCAKKCPYCDFNSHVRGQIDETRWREALIKEITTLARAYPNISIVSIFFGGGTPSLMPPEITQDLIDTTAKLWKVNKECEITLEANPSSVEAERFKAYRQAGVNRISVGVQSFREDALKFLGRLHGVDEAKRALDIARNTFDRISFDLIYARPDHRGPGGVRTWDLELAEALAFEPNHLSLYQLTIEDNTAFKQHYSRGRFKLPDEDEALDLFNHTASKTTAAGLEAYEISNHARVGEASRHNLFYWKGRPYIGIGPGAHGRLPHGRALLASEGVKRPEDWLSHVHDFGHGYHILTEVSPTERIMEALMMGLRLRDGVDITELEAMTGENVSRLLNKDGVAELSKMGFLTHSPSRIALTETGRPLLNTIIGQVVR